MFSFKHPQTNEGALDVHFFVTSKSAHSHSQTICESRIRNKCETFHLCSRLMLWEPTTTSVERRTTLLEVNREVWLGDKWKTWNYESKRRKKRMTCNGQKGHAAQGVLGGESPSLPCKLCIKSNRMTPSVLIAVLKLFRGQVSLVHNLCNCVHDYYGSYGDSASVPKKYITQFSNWIDDHCILDMGVYMAGRNRCMIEA